MIHRIFIMLFVLVVYLLVTEKQTICAAEQSGEIKAKTKTNAPTDLIAAATINVQDDTPEAAIRSFYTGLAKGDSNTVNQLLVSPDKMTRWVEVQIDLSNSFRQLGLAAVSHFGEEGKVLQTPVPAEVALKKLDTVKPVQNGDSAEWRINPKVPSKLIRINGHWKLDLYSSFQKPEDIAQQINIFGRIAKYVGKISADIEAGKFASIAEVREEFKRQRAILNEGASK